MTALLFITGVLLMALAIVVSIALHEVGHLVPAKLFGVRVPQYMIGFGKTIFSWRRGETEYGFKALPLGGYISMIGMYPPGKEGADGRAGGTSPLQQLAREARAADAERITEADQGRLFYQLPVYKRIIIMLGGPFMNLLIGVVATAVLVTGFGSYQPTTSVQTVAQCVQTVDATNANTANSTECGAEDPQSPANAAGLQPGDVITSFAGQDISSWDQLTELIRANAEGAVPMTVQRGNQTLAMTITPMLTVRPVYDELTGTYKVNGDGSYQTEEVGFIGIGPSSELTPGTVGEVVPTVGQSLERIGATLIKLPARVYGVAVTLATNGERDVNSPVSVVGVGRIAGEIAAHDQIILRDKAASLVSLIAQMNLMLFAFNLIPLLPLDGGHVLGALWEGFRRKTARLLGRRDPGPFDPVKLLPLTYVVAGAFLLMTVILVAADIFKPVNVL
ncbi:M50 family metallopeptidase [Rothia nasisuis]|uniref:M50 family metallopeptidase n=2 Tax=Rothia nasisuis TaxID=2109647 RepID=UPI001F1E91D4|nr:site-2 protease family protein [Rothia nasisuis]